MTANTIQTVSVQQLKDAIDQNPGLCLIDVREAWEWQSGHIAEAVLIPKDELRASIATHTPDHDTAVYLYCKGGVRSLYAAQELLAMGYRNVYSVDGGIMAWQACAYPVLA